MDSSVSVLNSSLNLNSLTTYLDFIAKGCQVVGWREMSLNLEIGNWEALKIDDIKDNLGPGEEGGKIRNTL